MKYKCLSKLGINNEQKKKRHYFLAIINKTLLAIFLGLVLLIVMEYSPDFKKYMQNEVLNKNISFGFIGKLYDKYFGEILPNNNDNVVKVFNEKLTYNDIKPYYDGYELSVNDNYLVPAIESGVVVFIGFNDNFGRVITIEDETGSTITYGNIKNSDIKLYEYINKGKYLGEVNDKTLYLQILKNGEYIDLETYLS